MIVPFRFVCILLLFVLVASGRAQGIPVLDPNVEHRIDSLLSLMTLEEKLGQLNQRVGGYDHATGAIREEDARMLRDGRVGAYLGVVGAERTRRLQKIAVEESRLGIPLLFGLDVIHGFRTTFPIPLAEAATWNPELIEQAARVAAVEATAAGIHWTFAPMVDIARDPRWGRIAEGAGEDPYLGSVMAAAKVRGFQGTNLKHAHSLLACAKHFAAYGGAEGGRDYNTVDVSERTLREIYLPPFKAAVEAGVGTLMCSFNEIGGVPSSGNRWLLTDVLRDEWKFNGFVVSDWESILEMINHGVGATRTDVGVLAINAGVDMDMVSGIYAQELVEAVRGGRVAEATVDRAVRRVLRAKFALGLFDNPYRNCDTAREKTAMVTPEHLALARRVAQQAIVLLKNTNNLLPLSKSLRHVAVLGPLADDRNEPRGPWAAEGRPEDVVTVLEGVRAKLPPSTQVSYVKGCEIVGDSGMEFDRAVRAARSADAVIVVVGEKETMSGEAASRAFIDLPGRQEDLLKALLAAGKPLVVVVMSGRPLALSWLADHADALVQAWFLGSQSGHALADVVFGDVNPSGKLPVTFPRTLGQVPLYYNHKNTGRPPVDSLKYTSKYIDAPTTPLFPFGFGLSYTTFAYSNLRLSTSSIPPRQVVVVKIDVANTGKRDGEEVAQLYIRDEVAGVTRPVKELKGFRRVALRAGEKKTVEFTVTPDDLAFYGLDMKRMVEPGWFTVMVGGSSASLLATRFEVR